MFWQAILLVVTLLSGCLVLAVQYAHKIVVSRGADELKDCSEMQKATYPELTVLLMFRFGSQFQRVQTFERFDENYRAQSQQDIDNFVGYIGPAFRHPPYFPPQPIDQHTGMPLQHNGNPNTGLQQASSSSAATAFEFLPQHLLPWQQQQGPSGQQQQSQNQLGQQQPQGQSAQQQPQGQSAQQQQIQQQSQQAQHQQPQQIQHRIQQWQQSNIVPFQRKPKSNTGPPEGGPGSIPGRFVDDDAASMQDTRPILLFDLNGTLTSHTAAKHSSGKTLIRPGTHHLRRLQASPTWFCQ